MSGRQTSTRSVALALTAYLPALYLLAYPLWKGVDAFPWVVASCIFIYLGSLALYDPSLKSSTTVMKATFFLFFALYFITIVSFTLFDGFFGRHATLPTPESFKAIKEYAAAHSNFIPLRTVGNVTRGFAAGRVSRRFFITNICGNLLAFAPFAFFMPLLFKRMKKFFGFLLFICSFVVLIEAAQLLLMTGSADIDDFILNVAGAALLYGILHIKPIKSLVYGITKLRI